MEHSVIVEINGLNVMFVIELVLKLGVRVMLYWVRVVAIVSTAVVVFLAAVLDAVGKATMMIPAVGVGVSVRQGMKYTVINELNWLDIMLIIELMLEFWVCVVVASVFIGEGSPLSIDKGLCSAKHEC